MGSTEIFVSNTCFRLTKIINILRTLSSPVVNASKFLVGTGILFGFFSGFVLPIFMSRNHLISCILAALEKRDNENKEDEPKFEQQAQFQQSTVDLTRSEQIRSLLVEIQVHLSNALNSRGRQRASWRNRVINSITSISELSHQILTIWPEIYEEVEESLDSTLHFRQQAPFRKKVCNIDKYGFPDVIQPKRTKPHKTEMSQFTFQVMCEVLTLATMLQKWHDYAYDDYKENNKELPKFVIEWLDLLIEQSHVLKSNMLGHDTMDEVSLSTEEDESSNTTDESSKPLLSESFGTNFDTSKPEKETPKHSIGINKVLFTLLNLDLLLLLTAMILILMYMVVIHMRVDLENPFEIKVPPFLDKYVYYVLISVYLVFVLLFVY